jgi:hypothetical protein
MNNNTYKIVIPPGCGFPVLTPVDPKTSKAKWRPYGRRVTPVMLAGGKSEDYFKKRYAAVRPHDPTTDEQSESYPRIINGLTKVNK